MVTGDDAVAPPAFDWKRWPETEALRRRADRDGAGGQRLRPRAWPSGCPARPARGSRTGSTTWSSPAGPAWPAGSRRWATSARPIRYAVERPVFAHRGGMLPRIAVVAASRATDAAEPGVREVAIKVESVAAFSRAHDLGLEIVGLSARPLSGRPGLRASGTTLAVVERRGYLGFEPFPGEPGARGPDEAARGPRRPGRARALARPAPTVRRRRRGVRRHRGDARPRDRAGGLDRPGLSPGLRGRARLLAVAEPRRAGAEGPAGPARAGLGEPRPPHLPFLPAVLPPPDRHVRAARLPAPRAVPRRRARRLGAPDPRAPDHRDRHLRRPRPRPRGGRPGLRPPGPARPAAAEHRRPLGRPARRVDPRGRHAPPRSPVRLRRPPRRPQGRGRHRDHEAVLRLPVPPPGVHRRRALARRSAIAPTACSSSAGSTPSSTRGSSARGRSAATSRTSSAARATRASTSRPSARSSPRPIRDYTDPPPRMSRATRRRANPGEPKGRDRPAER